MMSKLWTPIAICNESEIIHFYGVLCQNVDIITMENIFRGLAIFSVIALVFAVKTLKWMKRDGTTQIHIEKQEQIFWCVRIIWILVALFVVAVSLWIWLEWD